MDEAKAVAAGYGERAPVNRGIPTQSARSGEIPKIQTPLFGNMPPSALSGIVVQTFPSKTWRAVVRLMPIARSNRGVRGVPADSEQPLHRSDLRVSVLRCDERMRAQCRLWSH
ncbi:hypothetical protein FQK02_14005 [Xanthomonas vasicola]|nr:hypothetical protein FQK02_14005 [Xanthomonas vasicola]